MFALFIILQTVSSSTAMSHTNKAAHVQSQWGGHFSVGSRTYRNAVKRLQLLGIQLPSINADCGGIDVFLGGLGFVSGQGLIDAAKNIGSSALPFAFMLAMETVSPQIATGIKFLQNAAQLINSASISSCEGAAALIGSVIPRQSKLANHSCRLMASHKGHITDFVSGLKKCSESGDTRSRVRQDMEKDYPDTFYEAFNVAWMVLNKNRLWSSNKTDMELMMSITGTIIADGKGGFQVYSPLILDEEFFNAFAKGGTTKTYQCSGGGGRCLAIQEGQRTLTDKDTPTAQIQSIIASIEGKVREDKPLDPQEVDLVSQSSLPILKIINVMSVYNQKGFIDLMSYADVIAHDMVVQYIKEVIDMVRHMAQSLQDAQMNDEPLKKYMKNLRQVERRLEQITHENHQRIEQIFTIIKRTLVLEKAIYAKMMAVAKE